MQNLALDDMINLLEREVQYREDEPLTLADVEDVAFFEKLLDDEATEKKRSEDAVEMKKQEKALSEQTRTMRRTKNIKIRQRYSEKQRTKKQLLSKVRQTNKLNEMIDDTRCLKKSEY